MQDTQAPTLNEAELRGPEWTEGEWITLADGQRWAFPKPLVRLKPRFDGDSVELDAWTTFGPAFDSKVDAVDRAESNLDKIKALMALGADLLRRNYELGDDDCSELFGFTVGDERGEQMLSAIYGVATGQAPKVMPGG